MNDVTLLLDALQDGGVEAGDAVLAQVYSELRRLAAAKMSREQPGQTLQPTALVHEAWLKLVDSDGQARFENRRHFFGAAAEAMRRILIDRARRKQAARHGAGQERVDIADIQIAAPAADEEMLAVHEVLDAFALEEPRKAELVKLRYFAGFTIEETAQLLDISEPTAKRWWVASRAWLFREVQSRAAGKTEPGAR